MTRLLAISATSAWSGAERVLVRLLQRAAADGVNVRCAAPPGPLDSHLAAAGIERIPIPSLKLGDEFAPVAYTKFALNIARAGGSLRRPARQADVILANSLFALPPMRVAFIRTPVAYLVHDVLQRRDRVALLRSVASVVSTAIAVSDAAAGPVRAAKIQTIVARNGTPWPVDSAEPAPEPPFVVGMNAALTRWKGHVELIRAVAGLSPTRRRDLSVEILGGAMPKDTKYEQELRALVEDCGLATTVRFLGHVDDPLAVMRRWHVAVSASIEPEAAPLNVLEAMSLGIPLVGTDHGGTSEVLGQAGLLVAPRSVAALTDGIERMLADRSLRQDCAAAGRHQVQDLYRLDEREPEMLERILGAR